MSAADQIEPRPSAGMRRSTGLDRHEWFRLLDEWGAAGRPYREIADWLTGEHELSAWWAQKLIVEYEEARGLRDPGIRPDGTFSVGASKSIGVAAERVFEAFTDPELRERWLPGVALHERGSQPGRSARFDWRDDGTRISVDVATTAETRSQVGVQHEHLPDARTAQSTKTYWRERLTALKELLEGLGQDSGARSTSLG
jgi:hypothetical protein